MVMKRFFLVFTLAAVGQSFHTSNTYELVQHKTINQAVENDNAKKQIQVTEFSRTDANGIITNDKTMEPFLTYFLQEKLLSEQDPLQRQKRQTGLDSARLKRILSTKKGRKMAGKIARRKALSQLIKKRRKLRKQRKLNKGLIKGHDELEQPTVSTENASAPARQNNPSSTNEINLTVQVDMNGPSKSPDTSKNTTFLPQANNDELPPPSLGRLLQDHPIVSQKVLDPNIPSNNIFGIAGSRNSPFQTNSVPDIYRDHAFDSHRMYPSLPGILSGQRIMNSKGVTNSAIPEQIFDAGSHGNFPNNFLPKFDNLQPLFLRDGRGQESSAGIQRVDDMNNKKKQRMSDSFTSQTNWIQSDKQLEINNSGDKQEKQKVKLEVPLKHGQINSEIKNLLQEIKSVLNTRKAVDINDDESEVKYVEERTPETKSNLNENIDMQTDSSSSLSSSSSSEEEEEEEKEEEETEIDLSNIGETMDITESKHTIVPDTEIQNYDQSSLDKDNESSFENVDDFNHKNVITETYEHLQNPTTTSKYSDTLYEHKLSRMTEKDMVTTLQNLNLITKREKKLIQRMSKKSNSDNFLQNILDELMRRRYFRKSLEQLLESTGLPTIDARSGHNVILQLLKVEDMLLSSEKPFTETFHVTHGRKVHTLKEKEAQALPFEKHKFDNHPKNDFSNNEIDNNFSDHEHETDNIAYDNEHDNDNHQHDLDNNFSSSHHKFDYFSSNHNEFDNNFSGHDHEIDKEFSNREHDFVTNFPSHAHNFDNVISSHEH